MLLIGVAKLLLEFDANINTHSNEFKESALTLACYKGHLEMVKFLLGEGQSCDALYPSFGRYLCCSKVANFK